MRRLVDPFTFFVLLFVFVVIFVGQSPFSHHQGLVGRLGDILVVGVGQVNQDYTRLGVSGSSRSSTTRSQAASNSQLPAARTAS